MKRHVKQLGKDSVIYGLGGLLAKAVGLFVLPIYTRIFDPSEYGIISLLTVLSIMVAELAMLGTNGAQSFYFFERKNAGMREQARVVTACLQIRLFAGVCGFAVGMLLAIALNSLFFDGGLTWLHFAAALAASLLYQIVSHSAQVLRLLYRPVSYISIMLVETLSVIGLTLLFVVAFDMGIVGYFAGSVAASLFCGFAGWWLIRDYLDWHSWHVDWWSKLIRFGAPLVPAALAFHILSTCDRWFISRYVGREALGLYAVGAKCALLVTLAVTAFRQAWWPIAMDSLHTKDGPAFFRFVARFYLGIGIAGVVLLTTASPYLMRWIADDAYFDAYPVVGVLAWSAVLHGLYLVFTVGIWQAKRTSLLPLLTGLAAVLNLALNRLLVPTCGVMGAAVATGISYLAWCTITMLVSERMWGVGYGPHVLALQMIIGAAACYGILRLYHEGEHVAAAVPIAVVSVIALLLLSAKWEDVRSLMTSVRPYARGGNDKPGPTDHESSGISRK